MWPLYCHLWTIHFAILADVSYAEPTYLLHLTVAPKPWFPPGLSSCMDLNTLETPYKLWYKNLLLWYSLHMQKLPKVIRLRVSEDMFAQLTVLADSRGVTESKLLRHIIGNWISRNWK